MFKETTTTQLSAQLLTQELNYLKFLGLVFLIDYEYLKVTGCTITGSKYLMTSYGPVSLEIEKILQESSDCHFNQFIHYNGNSLKLIKNPGTGCLSDFIVEIIDKVKNKYQEKTGREIFKLIKNIFNDIENGTIISEHILLESAGFNQQEINNIQKENEYYQAVEKLMGYKS